jgi:hypothetical protein
MKTCKIIIGVLAVNVLFTSTTALAGTMRCGIHIISDGGRSGPGKYEVLQKCGEPTERFGNTWVYDRQGQAKRVLIFDDRGLLIDIQS